MGLFHHDDDDLRDRDRAIIEELKRIARTDQTIAAELGTLVAALVPRLSFIKVAFATGDNTMAEGPVTVTVGQSFKATVDGFDQNGAPWTGPIPAVAYSIDNSTLDSSTPESDNFTDDLVSLAAGTANLTASLTTAEGKSLTDTETVTNVAQTPVLSSIKINLNATTPAASAATKKA